MLILDNKWRYSLNKTTTEKKKPDDEVDEEDETPEKTFQFQCKMKGVCNASVTMRELKTSQGTRMIMTRWTNPKNPTEDLNEYHKHSEEEATEEAWQMKKEMIETLKENPHIRCDEARIKVVKKYEALNKDDLPKWDNVVTGLGSKQSTKRNLRRVRNMRWERKYLIEMILNQSLV